MTHDYKRHGTTTLFAALSMLDGKVIGDCMPRHRHQEFIRFLKKIDAADARGSGPAPDRRQLRHAQTSAVKSWLQRHPRFHLHFTPTSSSWLNMVERWFRELTDKRIRRGSFHNVPALDCGHSGNTSRSHNQNPQRLRLECAGRANLGKDRQM